MKKMIGLACGLLASINLYAAPSELYYFSSKGEFLIPASDNARSGFVKTNYIPFIPNKLALASGFIGETPASLACIYNLTSPVPGCPINGTTALPISGTGTISIVDPHDDPDAENELNTFSARYGLPSCTKASGCFSQVYVEGTQPSYNPDDAVEIALDIEWVHAMAPQAHIVLYEGENATTVKMYHAAEVAGTQTAQNGGGIISCSWGVPDNQDAMSQELEHFFSTLTNVIFVFSTGDHGAASKWFPATSPFVVSAGGTSIIRNNQGYFTNETGWDYNPIIDFGGGAGGPSLYRTRPSYQDLVQKIVGSHRGTPDISFDANPETGVEIYAIPLGGWLIVGGTSVSAPSLSGILFSSGAPITTAQDLLTRVYGNYQKSGNHNWRDITIGNNNPYHCLKGYDFVTGLGSPIGYGGFR